MREKELLRYGWKFTTEEQPKQEYDAYHYTKTGAAPSPATMSHDDHAWQTVELPHDYAVLQELNPNERDYNGYLALKDAWYRCFFYLPKTDRDRRLVLHLDGIAGRGGIWVNGCLMKIWLSAFCGYSIDISDVVRYGKEVNLIAIYLEQTDMQGWSYQGAGLYRDVWLEKTDRISIDESDLQIITKKKITTKKNEKEAWQVVLHCRILARYGTLGGYRMEITIKAPDGRLVASTELMRDSNTQDETENAVLEVLNPKLWDVYRGYCHTCEVRLYQDGILTDAYEEKFGFRECRFDAKEGFFINGRRTEIRGFCFHEDEGNLGKAIDASVYERRLKQLKAMGANAYRCSHNAPAKELLDLCDSYGILVMNETRRFDTGEFGTKELEYLVKRDRNHPSIILWSIGNEENWQGQERGKRIALTMRRIVLGLDDTRPVTMAMHTGLDGFAAEALDVVGVNYNHERLGEIHERFPQKPILGSEILCLADEVVECGNSYSGSQGAYETLEFIEQNRYLAGSFAWAGADYRGEHRNLAFFTDACPLNCNGDRKDGFYKYAARWREELVVHICGTWERGAALERKVILYTNAEWVRLFLNDSLVGEQTPDQRQTAIFTTPFEPGELKAIGSREGLETVDVLHTGGETSAFRLMPEKEEYPADGRSRITIWVEAIDEMGHCTPTSAHRFRVACDAKARIICTDNADPYCSAFPEKEEMCLYRGNGKIVLECGTIPGRLRVDVNGEKGQQGSCEILLSEANESVRVAEATENPYINDWFVTHIYKEEPNIYEYTTDDHYIYWKKSLENGFMLDQSMPFFYGRENGGYVIYCMEPEVPRMREESGAVMFEEITGRAKILVSIRDYNNRFRERYYAEKNEADAGSVRIPMLNATEGDRLILKVVVEGNHWKCGLTGPVRFEV